MYAKFSYCEYSPLRLILTHLPRLVPEVEKIREMVKRYLSGLTELLSPGVTEGYYNSSSAYKKFLIRSMRQLEATDKEVVVGFETRLLREIYLYTGDLVRVQHPLYYYCFQVKRGELIGKLRNSEYATKNAHSFNSGQY
ncbi:hypothetical protein OROHE_018272 [Orobanche hederae]